MFTHAFDAMGTQCILNLQGDPEKIAHAARLSEQEVRRLEQKYSRFRDDSIASEINHQAGRQPVAVDEETLALLSYANICYQQSDGMFDITSGVFRRIWDFKSGRLPTDQQIESILPLVSWSSVEWSEDHIFLPKNGMEVDFGGIVKEFAADRVADLCRQAGIEHGLVNLGGDMAVIGPQLDEENDHEAPWLIGIRDPRSPEDAAASIPLTEGGLATSGYYERFMMVDGRRYCHIINPKTGWPVDWCASVSVVSSQCLVSGSLATMAMLKESHSQEWLDDQGVPYLLANKFNEWHGTLKPL